MAMMISDNVDIPRPLSLRNQNITVPQNLTQKATQKETQKVTALALNVNDAIDNITDYSVSESLRIRINNLGQLNKNIQDDNALFKTAQGRGNSIVDSIKELRKLTTTATDDSLTDEDRISIQKDVNRLVNKISEDAQITFKGKTLIDGSAMAGSLETATVLSNNSLYSGTTAETALTELKNINGTRLGIEASDRVTASYVKDGNIYTTRSFVGDKTIEDIFKSLNTMHGIENAVFAGGGRGLLTEPVAPIKPEDPKPSEPTPPTFPSISKPEEVALPGIPSEFVPSSEPVMEDYQTTEQYEIDKAAYDISQSDPSKVIQKPDDSIDPDDPAWQTYNEAVANYLTQMPSYVQYRKDEDAYQEAYQEAMDNYYREYEQYEAELETYPDRMADYENNLRPKYLEDMEEYREKYKQYQADLAYYNLMVADIVKSDNEGLHVNARESGLQGQIAGVSITITDSSGNAKLSVNSALNNFKTTTFAADAREDNSLYFSISENLDQSINFAFDDMRAETFGLKSSDGRAINISTKEDAEATLATVNNALSRATEQVQLIGSSEKRFGYIADSLSIEISSIQDPDSMKRDTDRAKKVALYASNYFRTNISQSILATANQHSSSVIGLLK